MPSFRSIRLYTYYTTAYGVLQTYTNAQDYTPAPQNLSQNT